LLFTVSKAEKQKFLHRMKEEKTSVYEIGQIVPKSQGVFATDSRGNSFPLEHGFQHFRS
jgi:thiamine monophosphate kinase